MILEVYRLHSRRYPANSGKGAAIQGGRWNVPGVEAIYTAQSRSLAVLEILVHYAVLPRDFVLTPIHIPEDLVIVTRLPLDEFSPGLKVPSPARIDLTKTQSLGLQWFAKTAVLGVSSSIIPQERIYVLNPADAEFQYIEFRTPEPFWFDPRLKEFA